MGLDCYIFSTPAKTLQQVDLPAPFGDYEEVAYWRNNRDVQEWMRNLYFRKGGENQDFNGIRVQLTLEDIVQFIKDTVYAKSDGMYPYSLQAERDLRFLPKILEAIADGQTVFYTSSW